ESRENSEEKTGADVRADRAASLGPRMVVPGSRSPWFEEQLLLIPSVSLEGAAHRGAIQGPFLSSQPRPVRPQRSAGSAPSPRASCRDGPRPPLDRPAGLGAAS